MGLEQINSLAISNSGKGIPYGGIGEARADGSENHGFRLLKGSLERLSEIPELREDDALRDLVAAINAPETGLLSVGCGSYPVVADGGHRVTGYIEFAFNSVEGITDAGNYFPMFFHFDRMLFDQKFDLNVRFNWELMGASFREVPAEGFTMTVFVNTGFHGSPDSARDTWADALGALTYFLGHIPPRSGPTLYGTEA